MSFEEHIKHWVSLDNKIRDLNTQVKELRSKRTSLTDKINSYVNENDLNKAIINISDGKLKFQNVKTQQPLTLKFIKQCLDDCIKDENDVDMIIKYIKSQRETKVTEEIKRYYN